jgi:serine protease Do
MFKCKQPGIILLMAGALFLFLSQPAQGELPDFTELAKKSGPAVVNISTVKVVETSKRLKEFFHPFQRKGSPFEDFFDQFMPDAPQKRKENALGSGFIISRDGYVVTNNHVVEKADEIKVVLQGGEESYPAEIVGRDPETDLALLKIEAEKDLPVLKFGDSQDLEVGQWVMAIGNPFGLDHTVTAGIISAKGRVIGAGPYDNFIQTDASINPGNSGGPLLNGEGRVVGINTAIVASGQGIGFAIPSSMAEDVIAQLKKYQKVKRGWLGVTIQDVDENTAKALGLSESKGALVASVRTGDPADEAGIRVGDVIVSVNGKPIESAGDLTRTIGGLPPDETVNMTVWRKGEVKELEVTLGEREVEVARGMPAEKQQQGDVLGMELKTVNAEEAESLGLTSARGLLVVEVMDASPAAEANIRPGDVILEANGQPVDDVSALEDVLDGDASKKGVVMFLIKRQGQNLFRTIPLPE